MKEINVLLKRVGDIPRAERIPNTLETLQKTVGGYIETFTLGENLVVICDEEGKLKNKAYNCEICGEIFVGDIILAGVEGEEFADSPSGHKVKQILPSLWR